MKLLHEMITPFALMLWAGSGLCFLAYGLAPSDPSNVNFNFEINIFLVIFGYSFSNCNY